MNDMQTSGAGASRNPLTRGVGSGTAPGENPFGPHPRTEREDQWVRRGLRGAEADGIVRV